MPVDIAVENLRALGLTKGSAKNGSFFYCVENLVREDVGRNPQEEGLCGSEVEELDNESESLEDFEKRAVNVLCAELMEEVFDDDSYHLSGDSKVVQRKPGAKTSRKKAAKKLKMKINKFSSL